MMDCIGMKKGKAISEGVLMLSSILGYGGGVPDIPVSRSHRILDKTTKQDGKKVQANANYKPDVIDYVRRNPKSSAKQIASGIKVPYSTVLTIVAKAHASGLFKRHALHEQTSSRPKYLYWIEE